MDFKKMFIKSYKETSALKNVTQSCVKGQLIV